MNRVPGDGTTAGEELKALGLRYETAIGAHYPRRCHLRLSSGPTSTRGWLCSRSSARSTGRTAGFVPGGRLTGAEVGQTFADIFLQGVLAEPAPVSQGPQARPVTPCG